MIKNAVRRSIALGFVGCALGFTTSAHAQNYCTADVTVTSVTRAPSNQPNSILIYVDITASRTDTVDVFIKWEAFGGGVNYHGSIIEKQFSGGHGSARGIAINIPDGVDFDPSSINISDVHCYRPG